MLEYMFSHSYWGLCAWDLPALIVLAVMMIIFMIHLCKMEKREEAFEEELARREAEESEGTEQTC